MADSNLTLEQQVQALQQQMALLQQQNNVMGANLKALSGNPNLPIGGKYNTYIGARYVPKFANPVEWNATTQYEPLTIVTYQGNSYTSKTFPPVGVLPTNTTYWAPTGNYNAQVEAYRQEVLDVKNSLDNIKSNIITIETQTNRILTPNQTKKYLFQTDSYGNTYEGVTQSFVTLVQKQLNADIIKISTGGYGFNGFNNQYYIDILKQWVTNNPSIVPTITDIWVFGGANEITSGLEAKINEYISYIKTTFPQANLCICFYGAVLNSYVDTQKMVNVKLTYDIACGNNGIRFGGDLSGSMLGYIGPDFIHPNQTGQQLLANCVIQTMYGNVITPRGSYKIGGLQNVTCQTDGHYNYALYGSLSITDIQSVEGVYNSNTLKTTYNIPVKAPFPKLPIFNGYIFGLGYKSGEMQQLIGELTYYNGILSIVMNNDVTNLSTISANILMLPYAWTTS